ncbi:MAG: hypothetical protein ACREBB_10240 [Nitrosotalea sp.]
MFRFVEKKSEKTDYIVGREWSVLKKAWKEYRKARDEDNTEKMTKHAKKILNLQKKLGVKQSEFPELKMISN